MGQIVSSVVALFLTMGLCFSLLLVEKKQTTLVCKDIAVTIQDYPEQSFITPQAIVALLQSTHKISLHKTLLNTVNTYAIQHQLTNHPLIKNALVYKTWNGTVKICLKTRCFIARIISPLPQPIGIELQKSSIDLMETNGYQIYLDKKGAVIDLKDPPLLRLLVVTGQNIAIENNKLRDKRLLALLGYIYKDSFWRRQITSLQVTANGKIIMGTQVGGHQIEFGTAENIEEKFEKLQLFYSQVIPYKGWEAYHRVNVAFKDQLICE
ncbi:hypothetical protein [Cardinium endosymbiont of Nabis limbatus]|uniref:hypothetical protein n=1 Tax=Cardinium endosymbiont of Nabis limbatus TaxID=3066217 RepID=UPI003AF3A386